MTQLFSVPIFFIMLRETLEASIIVSVLLGLVEQIVRQPQHSHLSSHTLVGSASSPAVDDEKLAGAASPALTTADAPAGTLSAQLALVDGPTQQRRLVRKMRIQIFAGAACGLLIALAIGAAFLAVYYTTLADLWGSAEELWEGIFSLVASLMIFVMGIAMLKMDRAKAKWRVKLQAAFHTSPAHLAHVGGARTSKYALFLLPLVTVLREGLEAVVFVGGISLGQAATAIPIAAIAGLVCGLLVGLVIYFFSTRVNVSIFLVISTTFLLLIGAGLFTRSISYFQTYAYNNLVGGDVAETGSGPGSYSVHGNVWHLDCCNPEDKFGNQGWSIFNALFGWNNNATVGSILGYIAYWVAVIVCLAAMKWHEGRFSPFGRESAAATRRRERRAAAASPSSDSPATTPSLEKRSSPTAAGDDVDVLPK